MEKSPPGRSWAGLWALAELFALTGLVIAQPVLDVTGRSSDLFLFRRPTGWTSWPWSPP